MLCAQENLERCHFVTTGGGLPAGVFVAGCATGAAQPTETVTVTAEPTTVTADPAAAAPADGGMATTITDGIYTVGLDIQPGTYRVTTKVDPANNCFWGIYKSGSNGSATSYGMTLCLAASLTVTLSKGGTSRQKAAVLEQAVMRAAVAAGSHCLQSCDCWLRCKF